MVKARCWAFRSIIRALRVDLWVFWAISVIFQPFHRCFGCSPALASIWNVFERALHPQKIKYNTEYHKTTFPELLFQSFDLTEIAGVFVMSSSSICSAAQLQARKTSQKCSATYSVLSSSSTCVWPAATSGIGKKRSQKWRMKQPRVPLRLIIFIKLRKVAV